MKTNLIYEATFKYYDKLKRITEPLKMLNINTFWYFNISSSGEFNYLGNYPAFAEYYFSNELYKHNPFFKRLGSYQPGIFYARAVPQGDYQKCIDLTSKNYNVDNSLIIVKEKNNGYQGFGFATKKDNSMYQLYLNYLPLLKKYTTYFEDETKSVQSKFENYQVDMKALIGERFYQKPDCLQMPMVKLENFSLKLLGLPFHPPSITKREQECLDFSLQGMGAKEIAEKLSISHRTVERYLDNLKLKFHCETKYELLMKALHLKEIYPQFPT